MSNLILKDVSESNDVADCTEKAITDVCEVCSIPRGLILSRSRQEHVAVARFFLYTILRNAGFTWTHIGQVTGRDHGAAYMGAKRLEGRLLCKEKVLIMMRDRLLNRGWRFAQRFFYDY